MFRSRAALIFIAAAALVLASTGLISRPTNQLSTELPAIAISDPVFPPQLKTTGEMLVNADSFDLIFRGSPLDDEAALTPGFDTIPRRDDGRSGRNERGTYRTLGVRPCDGFYFPISFATRRKQFGRDERQCEQSRPFRARLRARNPGEAADDNGRPRRAPVSQAAHCLSAPNPARCGLHLPRRSMA
jgi:Protein of unknown function (DUF2865)